MTRHRAYLLSHSNISLAEVNELDTGRPQPAPQTISMRSFPLFSLHAVKQQPEIFENSNFT